MPVPKVRRVVTGQTPDGSSVLTHIEDIPGITNANGLQWYGVWGWQEMPTLPYATTEPFRTMSVFPASGGVRVNTIVFPPRYGHADAARAAQASDGTYEKLEAELGSLRHDARPGMHTTDSVDFGFVASGEIVSIQGDGSEVTLRLGDVYVQNGAMHAWRNDSNEPCMITFVVMGTTRKSE
ncbi:MAG: cupin domain-containing protein [Hyphomicrobiales bacterium]|nr:cupin domain-containing protein [Hyphomicrobiales bacterium]